jgi:hypothetical protein
LENGKTMKVIWFEIGDLPFSNATAGRKTPCSLKPFISCHCTHKMNEKFTHWKEEPCILRTKQELFTINPDEGQLKEPLFKIIDPFNYVPGLHLYL